MGLNPNQMRWSASDMRNVVLLTSGEGMGLSDLWTFSIMLSQEARCWQSVWRIRLGERSSQLDL